MSVIASCQCGYSKVLTEFYAGTKVRCPRCGSVVFVPVGDTVYDIDELPDFNDSRSMKPVHPGETLVSTQLQHPGIPQQQAQRPQAYIPKPATDQIPLRPAAQSPADGSKQFNEIFSCDKGSCGLFSFVAPALVLGAGVIAVFASSQPRGVVVGALAFGVGLLYTWCRSVARKGVIAGVIAMVLSLAGITLALTNHADRAQKYAIKFWPTYQTCPFDDCRSKDQKIKTPPKSEKSQQQLPHAPKQPLPEGEQEF